MHLTDPKRVSAAWRQWSHHTAVEDSTLSPPALLFSIAYWRIYKEIR